MVEILGFFSELLTSSLTSGMMGISVSLIFYGNSILFLTFNIGLIISPAQVCFDLSIGGIGF